MLRWITRLFRRRHDLPLAPPSAGQQAANAALAPARVARQMATDRRPAVDAAAAELRLIRERNHFAELIRTTVLGGAPR